MEQNLNNSIFILMEVSLFYLRDRSRYSTLKIWFIYQYCLSINSATSSKIFINFWLLFSYYNIYHFYFRIPAQNCATKNQKEQ
jgi:hypothetical protein